MKDILTNFMIFQIKLSQEMSIVKFWKKFCGQIPILETGYLKFFK